MQDTRWEVLPLCRDAVGVLYCPSRQGNLVIWEATLCRVRVSKIGNQTFTRVSDYHWVPCTSGFVPSQFTVSLFSPNCPSLCNGIFWSQEINKHLDYITYTETLLLLLRFLMPFFLNVSNLMSRKFLGKIRTFLSSQILTITWIIEEVRVDTIPTISLLRSARILRGVLET